MAKDELKKIKILTVRETGVKRVYSNHVEFNISPDELNFKFSDVKPPENEEVFDEIKKTGKAYIPVDVEVVIPIRVATELSKLLSERIKAK